MLDLSTPTLHLMFVSLVSLVELTFTPIAFNPGSVEHGAEKCGSLFSFTEVTLCAFFVQAH